MLHVDYIETLQGLLKLNSAVCWNSLPGMVMCSHLPSPQWSCPLDIIDDDIRSRVARAVLLGLKYVVNDKTDLGVQNKSW